MPESAQNWLMKEGFKILIAAIYLIISFKLINWLARKVEEICEKKLDEGKLDKTICRTLAYITKIG